MGEVAHAQPAWVLLAYLVAVALASVNIFGGFAVTQRMLAMYKKRDRQGDKPNA